MFTLLEHRVRKNHNYLECLIRTKRVRSVVFGDLTGNKSIYFFVRGVLEFRSKTGRPDVMILKIFLPKFAEKMAFLTQNGAKLCNILVVTLVSEKNAIFRRILSKISKNCDHKIDPRLGRIFA
jgi:hypothetical protein